MWSGCENRKLKAVAVLIFVAAAGVHFAFAQGVATKPTPAPAKPQTATEIEETRLRKFLDKNGGYRDKFGGYYDSKAGTYTDEKGGVLDIWEGYTYKDGSYKSKLGDYWDAPTGTFKLASGEVVKSPGTSSADAITVLRGAVKDAGRFDKTFLQRAMLGQIAQEHPAGPTTEIDEAWAMRFVDKNGGYRDKAGGYYDPKAGTYTDDAGGFVDNWAGYTYKDGSYKSKLGDYWDGPSKTFKLADGRVASTPTLSNADAIKALRQNVADNGGYDADFIRRGMLTAITNEHPPGPAHR